MPLILEIVSLGKSAREPAGGCEHCLSANRIVNAFIKDQVTPMLFSKHIVSTRTLFQLTVALVFFFVAAVGAAVAANSGNPPQLVPYTMTVAAGTSQYSTASSPGIVAGYGGDIGYQGSVGYAVPWVYSGTMGTPSTGSSTAKVAGGASLSGPYGFAVDAVGNLYIADKGNDIIREVDYASGLINTVAGVTPTGCKLNTSTINTWTSCSSVSGCADGVPASANKIGGGIEGIAVDSFGNVYFTDNSTSTASIIYHGGTRVADFIKRVDPEGVVASSGVVQVGYLYHIAGEINLKTCKGSTSNPTTLTVIDNAPAFEDTNNQAATSGTFPGATSTTYGATLNGPSNISLDSAGNIYISDVGNGTTRVINTQETPQTFFQYTLPPGYMRSIINCSSTLTVSCTTLGATATTYVATGVNGPANTLVYTNDYDYSSADAYGNVYQVNTKGATPGIYAAVGYAGGTPLNNLLNVEAPYLSSIYSANETAYVLPALDQRTPNEIPLTYGNVYIVGGQPATAVLPGAFLSVLAVTTEELVIRPTSWVADTFGTDWYYDNHYPEVFRIDQYTATATGITWGDALTGSPQRGTTVVSGLSGTDKIQNLIVNSSGNVINGTISNYNTNSPATFTNTWNCVYGAAGAPWLYGPQTFDPEGDGCPSAVTKLNGGNYYTYSDGLGNIYIGDSADEIIHEVTIGTQFPALPVGTTTPVTQEIQVHFDASNIPVTGGAGTTVSIADGPSLGFTTTSFTIVSGTGDYSFDTTTQEFPLGSLLVPITGLPLGWGESTLTPNFNMYPTQAMLQNGQPALPTCTQLGTAENDNSWDCLVNVKFSPTGVGLRTGQLVATTANGSVYNFQLTGYGTGSQLAIDGGSQTVVSTTGLGAANAVAVTATGALYIADPTNNQIVVKPASGSQSAITTMTGVTPTTLSKPMGVAVDAANNVYISDTGNNRILKYNPITGAATQLGNYLWIPGATCDTPGAQASDCVFQGFATQVPSPVPNTTANPNPIVANLGPSGSSVAVSILNEPGASVGLTAAVSGNPIVLTSQATYTIPGTTGTTAPAQYTFKSPQGLAVDTWGNVYVADTGNGVVVLIPSNSNLGGATPLLQYAGAPAFVSPVAIAIGAGPGLGNAQSPYPSNSIVNNGFIYVADSQSPYNQIVRLPPGGGDLQPAVSGATSALYSPTAFPLVGGNGITSPTGVAVDAAGNVYISDSGNNTVWETPANTSYPMFALSFAGLSSPAGLALDPNGNVYVADSGNNRVLFMNRQNPTASFGTVPQDLGMTGTTPPPTPSGISGTPAGCPVLGGPTACTGVLTVSNIGNTSVALSSPATVLSGSSEYTSSSTCSGSSFQPGYTCTISPLFTPTVDGPPTPTGSITVNGTQTVALVANGANPEAKVVLSASPTTGGTSPNFTVATGTPVTLTATATQPHIAGAVAPTGTVVFTLTIDANTVYNSATNPNGAGAPIVSPAETLTVSGSSSSATFTFTPTAGLSYTVNATFTPNTTTDTQDSTTLAQSPIVLTAPPAAVPSVTDNNYTYFYGQVPAIPSGTITWTPSAPTGVTAQWISNASQCSAVAGSPYNVQVLFLNSNGTVAPQYGNPTVYLTGSTTTAAQVIEKPASLTVSIPAYTTVYGAPTFNFASGMTVGGLVCGNQVSASFSTTQGGAAVNSSILAVGSYTLYATMTGKAISAGDYTITPNPATTTEVVTQAPSGMTITPAKANVTPAITGVGPAAYITDTAANLTGATYAVTVNSLVAAGSGTPSGTISVTDNFVPITSTVLIPTPTSGTFPLNATGGTQWPAGTITIAPCATVGQTTPLCNPVVTLSSASATITLPNANGTSAPPLGTHYLSFAYSGDSNFVCSVIGQAATTSPACPSTGLVPYALVVDNADFTMTDTVTTPISVQPGNVPNQNGLPSEPGQSTSNAQSTIVTIGGINSFTGNINLSCATSAPTYLTCFIGQLTVINGGVQTSTTVAMTTSNDSGLAVVFSAQTPAQEPLGFNTTAQLRTTATRTVLAFLPFGVLAFCVRRRRRLSKALWMLIAVAMVSVGMSGCGGNYVDFYTPIPTGAQSVVITGSYTNTTTPSLSVSRTLTVPINII
jgi:sugar lactone lactonase YvrE